MKLTTLIRWIIGAVFIWAAIAKLLAPNQFFGSLLGYELPIAETILRLIVVTLPWFELACGVALLGNLWPETIRPLVGILCAIFLVAITQALIRGFSIDCGCFGGSEHSWFNQPLFALGRTTLLLAGSLFLWRSQRAQRNSA
jgi:putative oxidoreductase